MLLASRKEPPKYLQVPSPATRHSSKIKEFLLHSPLPSPALPSILPRHGKKPPALNTRRTLRYITWMFILTTVFYLAQFFRSTQIQKQLDKTYQRADGQIYEIVEDTSLPDWSSPLAVTDADGNSRWTVHIPSNKGFPLPSEEYADICSHINEVADHVASIRGNYKAVANLTYYQTDPNYIDVATAQLNELIPFDPSFKPGGSLPVCASSMIYVLDSSDAGLGSSLMGLWLAYGLAQREKRAFFVDDSHWTYGRYSTFFENPPSANCRPPPPTHRVPCPRMSQHLVVTPSTWQWTFGESFRAKFSDKEIFDLMRVGYQNLFKLAPDDQMYVAERMTELRQKLGPDTLLAGMHIRRGDKHPDEFQYQWGYIPPADYAAKLRDLVDESSVSSLLSSATSASKSHTFLLASDDADMYHDPELRDLVVRAQERILLTSNKQIEEFGAVGWERGFFKDAFWNLGLPDGARRLKQGHFNSPLPTKDSEYEQRKLDTKHGEPYDSRRDYHINPTDEARQQRNYIARAYLLDLAILAQSDRLVCAVSSRGCRVLGVMMGWDKVKSGHWRNIDQGLSLGWRAEL